LESDWWKVGSFSITLKIRDSAEDLPKFRVESNCLWFADRTGGWTTDEQSYKVIDHPKPSLRNVGSLNLVLIEGFITFQRRTVAGLP
jgi:hypothetical protein